MGSGWLEGLGLQVLLTLLLASLWLWSLLGPQEAGIVCLISAAAPGSLGLQAQALWLGGCDRGLLPWFQSRLWV